MSKVNIVIKRNTPDEKGMFGVSIHDEPGGAGNIQPIESEAELRHKLLEFGTTEAHADDIILRLKEKHDSVKIEVERPRN